MSGALSSRIPKVAWIRDPGIPPGRPAPGRFDCPCGQAISGVEFGGPPSTCPSCGTVYDGRGWVIGRPSTTTELAAVIEASPRFDADPGYFDALARWYGRDFAGLAFTQACIKRDQDPSG